MWYHTHSVCPPSLLLGKHRCDNLARTTLSAAYPAWPSWQLQWCVPAAHPRLRIVEVHRLGSSRTPKGKNSHKDQVRWSRGPLAEHLVILFSTHQPRCCEVSSILNFTALWRRAGILKIYRVNVSAVPYL